MTQTKRERHADMIGQKQATFNQLEALKKQRSDALISGEAFTDSDKIVTLADEVQALDHAIAVLGAQADDEEADEYAAWKAAQLSQSIDAIEDYRGNYLDAVATLHAAFTTAADKLRELEQLRVAIHKRVLPISGEKFISALEQQSMAIRLSERMGRLFSSIDPNSPGNFGQFQWIPEGFRVEDWHAEEKALLAANLDHILRKARRTIADSTAPAEGA